MAEARQSVTAHTRWYPLFHFVAAPAALIYTLYACNVAVTTPSTETAFSALFAVAVLCGIFASRTMALRVQDRLIRLEETLRMQRILPSAMHASIAQIAPRQFVALRFASDEELTNLVTRVLAGDLTEPKAIKQAVKVWRADWLRA